MAAGPDWFPLEMEVSSNFLISQQQVYHSHETVHTSIPSDLWDRAMGNAILMRTHWRGLRAEHSQEASAA